MALPSASRIDLADIVVGEECEGQENLGGEAGQRRGAFAGAEKEGIAADRAGEQQQQALGKGYGAVYGASAI